MRDGNSRRSARLANVGTIALSTKTGRAPLELLAMKTLLTLIVLFVSILATAYPVEAAAAKKGKRPQMTREELFKKLDLNSDGQLSLGEFIGKRTGDAAKKAEETFAKLDADKSGFLSFDEFKLPNKKKPK
jgi:hypothetical protein